MNRAARSVKHVVQEIECPFLPVALVIADRKRDLLNMRTLRPLSIFGKQQKIGLAHIEVEIDWIE